MNQESFNTILLGTLKELLQNSKLYYQSTIDRKYNHLTEEGQVAILNLVDYLLPELCELEKEKLDLKIKQQAWSELNK